MASGVGGLRASLIAAGRGGHNVRRPERKTAPKPSREAVNPLGRGDMDLTFGCVLSQAAYGPMAGPTAIRTGAATHISGHFSGIEPPLFVRRTPAVRRAQEPERGTSAGCWASA